MAGDDRIRAIETFIVDVPLKREYAFDGMVRTSQSLLIVRLGTEGGATGLGEAAIPLDSHLSPETVETAELVIQRYLAPALVGMSVRCPGKLRTIMDAAIGGQLAAKGALEGAAYDAWARSLGVPLGALLGGVCQDRIPLSWLLTGTDPFVVAEEAQVVTQEVGFDSVTIRMCGAPPAAVSHACAVARLLDGRTRVHVNASGAWPRLPAQIFAAELSHAGVVLIEQPCAPSDIETLARLTERSTAAIAAVESVASAADAVELTRRFAVDVFTVHPTTCGGLRSALSVIHIAEGAEIACRIGTTFGGEISVATALHLAATIQQLPFGTDLFGPMLIDASVVTRPLSYEGGFVQVPTGPGIGVELDEIALKEFARH